MRRTPDQITDRARSHTTEVKVQALECLVLSLFSLVVLRYLQGNINVTADAIHAGNTLVTNA